MEFIWIRACVHLLQNDKLLVYSVREETIDYVEYG